MSGGMSVPWGGLSVPGGWEFQGGWVFQGDGSSRGMGVPGDREEIWQKSIKCGLVYLSLIDKSMLNRSGTWPALYCGLFMTPAPSQF